MAKTGPKTGTDNTALDLPNRRSRSRSFEDFCRRYFVIKSKKGTIPLRPRPWQIDIVSQFFDTTTVRLAGLQIGRGNGKSTLLAAIALWDLFTGQYGANVVCCAVDERQAGIIYEIARYAVEHSPELAARAQVYKDQIRVPGRAATLRVLPAEAKRLEGLDFSLAILDEAGFASNETFATLLDSQGKREQSILCLIGTPGPNADSPLGNLRTQALEAPDDALTTWVEFSADSMRSCAWDDETALRNANPAYGDFLHASGVDAARPPKVPEARWRRVRLGQWVTGSGDGWIDRAPWDACRDDRTIPEGFPCVVALDGSRVEDSTALVLVSIEEKPIVQLVKLYEPHLEGDEYRVPVLDLEAHVRKLADVYDIREVTGDPAQGWNRSFDIFANEGLTVAEFSNHPSRTIPAIAAFKIAVLEGELSHNGDEKLAAHITNAVMVEKPRGYVIGKPAAKSKKKIDAAICAVMAHHRARWHQANPPKSGKLRVMKMRK